MWGIVEAVTLGLIQGFLEWLPVSSSGIVMIVGSLMGLPIEEAYKMAIGLHLGTLLAVVFKFKREYWTAFSYLYKGGNEAEKIFKIVFISTLFTGFVGLPIYFLTTRYLETADGNIRSVMIFTGILLAITSLISLLKTPKSRSVSIRDGVWLGILQGLAAAPGISRSGLTVAGLIILGIDGEEAFRWSFLASGPAILGAIILEVISNSFTLNYLAFFALAAATLAGILTMDILIRAARVLPRWALSGFVATLLIVGSILM